MRNEVRAQAVAVYYNMREQGVSHSLSLAVAIDFAINEMEDRAPKVAPAKAPKRLRAKAR